MFVVNPDPYLVASFRLSPFKTDYIGFNANLVSDDYCIHYLNEKFGIGKWQFTYNGREAIKLALTNYNLQSTDLVTIVTTSENYYISSCVTKEIETFCNWNREIVPETKVLFVNHEFGYPYPNMEKLLATGLPIIEDCCTTFFSQDEKGDIGKYGAFSVYSLPKFFPIQIGGILVNNSNNNKFVQTIISKEEEEYIQNVLSFQFKNETELLKIRRAVYDYATDLFLKLGFTLRFNSNKNIIPYALLLNNNSIIKDLQSLKMFFTYNGIQSSVFYGEDAFFIPNHQTISFTDINYFVFVTENYLATKNE